MAEGNVNRCHDCGVAEGEIHQRGCDMEKCPACGGQLITCGCIRERMNYGFRTSAWVGDGDLTKPQEEHWQQILEKLGRVPYIIYPVICCRCGKLWPDSFDVPNEEWRKYVPLRHRGSVLCRKCYDIVKGLIDSHERGTRRTRRLG